MALQIFQQVQFVILSIIMIFCSLVLLVLVKETEALLMSVAKPNCPEKCGNMSVPFPFGIGKGCYLNEMFEVTCNKSSNSATLSYVEAQVFHISMEEHYVEVNGEGVVDCHNNESGKSYMSSIPFDPGQPFRVSHTRNNLVAIGCDIFAYITESNTTKYITGCASLCYHNSDIVGPSLTYNISPSSCDGIGCCQTSLPKDLNYFDLRTHTMNTDSQFWVSKPCTIVFFVEKFFSQSIKFNISGITDFKVLTGIAPMVFDWAIGNNISCRQARTRKDYLCGRNSYCKESSSYGIKYGCHCLQGYQGNPYLKNGCQDIDECKDPKKKLCPEGALCSNTRGSYLCTCKPGYQSIHGDGTECIPDKGRQSLVEHISLGIGIAIGILVLIAIGFWLYRKLEKRQKNKMKQKFFKRNGGLLLQQQISSSNKSVVKTKVFIVEELEKATDNFNESRVLGKGGLGTVYKGMLLDGSIVAVKKSNIVDENQVGQFINEVIILSCINHRNILKLLGCCLETEVPLLVYEYVSKGTLSHHIHDEGYASTMSWNTRLRIAREVASALAYLHSYASTAIFHRDIKSSNILLDENYRAVVSDFGLSRSVPLNKTHLTTLVGGTFGYLDPEYFRSGQLTDKSDVYAFGVILAELLTGKKAVSSDKSDECLVLNFRSSMKQNHLFEILETLVVNDGKEEEIQAVANLAKRCLKMSARKRPTMKEVVAELDHLRRIQEQPLLKHNRQDSYSSVSGKSFSYIADAVEEES